MTGRFVRFLLGLIVGVVVAGLVKGGRGSEGPSEGATTG